MFSGLQSVQKPYFEQKTRHPAAGASDGLAANASWLAEGGLRRRCSLFAKIDALKPSELTFRGLEVSFLSWSLPI
ncbi:hypothetical protein CLOSTMETH_03400 [[Clostridium] methylpentosum DSM 5476]|uniref:Uncharacterized protein n=1 Tax=[Clostridium] methylpentosum DSM 5476 TaxID=537013 RepID=C0EHQ5_9FIRM|nr:hypothetical protein CLOSTMETH_03400 [[Clostridium] methylpentosum DSM 5476]